MYDVNLEELRNKARTEYGITNADELDAERLQSEIDAIDQQAIDAEKETAKHETDQQEQSAPDEEQLKDLTKLSRGELEARASEVGVDGDPTDKEKYPNKGSLVEAIEAKA